MKTVFMTLILALGLQAAPLLTLEQNNISSTPGGIASWMFRLTPDSTNWTSVTSSFLVMESNPGLGLYLDEIGLLGGPSGRLGPLDADWLGNVGYYQLDPFSLVGDRNEAILWVTYELFSGDPSTCSGCLISSGIQEFNVSVEVVSQVTNPVPEPGTWSVGLAGVVMVAWQMRLRMQRGRM